MTTVLIYPFDVSDTVAPATFFNAAASDTISAGDKINTYVSGNTLFILRLKA